MLTKTLYTAEATVSGGRTDGHARTSDGQLDVRLRLPPELGGDGEGTNPEQLFAAGFAACFDNALAAVARRQKLEPGEVTVTSRVNLHPTEERGFGLSVELDIAMAGLGAEDAKGLAAAAHAVCPYSHATRGNITVTLRVNGEPVT